MVPCDRVAFAAPMLFKLTLFLIGFGFVAGSVGIAQVPATAQRDRGIALLQEDKLPEALTLLTTATKKDKKDIRAWHWLGIALEKQQKLKDALKAHEKTAKIGDELQTSASERTASLPKIELMEAADSAERFLSLSTALSDKKKKEWRDRADFLRLHANSRASEARIYKSSEVTTRARVLKKPEPSYTEDARNNQVTGTVVLRCIFAADGRVRNIYVIWGLPGGLTERAIEAARKIKFIPATVDGKPVSMWMQLEYNFNLY